MAVVVVPAAEVIVSTPFVQVIVMAVVLTSAVLITVTVPSVEVTLALVVAALHMLPKGWTKELPLQSTTKNPLNLDSWTLC